MSELVNMSIMPAISDPDKLMLSNRLVMSKFSASKLLIKPLKSMSSNSRPNTFKMAERVFMSISRLLRISISSVGLIADKSQSPRSIPKLDKSIPIESINPVKSSLIASKNEKSQFLNMLSKSTSELVNISIMPTIPESDKLRLANKLDMSKFSASKLLIKPFKSRLSKSVLDNFDIAVIAVMINSELVKTSISSGMLISDKS